MGFCKTWNQNGSAETNRPMGLNKETFQIDFVIDLEEVELGKE